jgi:hypothetical protein
MDILNKTDERLAFIDDFNKYELLYSMYLQFTFIVSQDFLHYYFTLK